MSSHFPGKIKIIGGTHKGRNISVPEGEALRPTPNRLRETLFNWLQFELNGANILDLFAGSGALGLESLSRGAHNAIFVEKSKSVSLQLKKTLAELKLEAEVHMSSAQTIIPSLPKQSINVVFIDPPFSEFEKLAYPCLSLLIEHQILRPHARIYLEMPKSFNFSNRPPFNILKEKVISEVRGVLLEWNPEHA